MGKEVCCTHADRTGLHIERFFWGFLGMFYKIFIYLLIFMIILSHVYVHLIHAVAVEANRGHWAL